ncbi:MAG: nucleotide sugar dehydrogenase [Nocardioides sp.]|uniref:nucleotide sugar dehydrogenase n=1 Tax=Nocardioides sp. TaxID=35761 RepID=UPI0039E55740
MMVAVIGQGYVGLPLAVHTVNAGHTVVGFDTDSHRVASLRRGNSDIEDVSGAILREALATGRYLLTDDESELAGFDVAVISVPTPLRDRVPDLTCIDSAARSLAQHLTIGATVILESTTYPGTTDELLADILADISGLKPGLDFHLGYSPERVDPGNPDRSVALVPKLIAGIDGDSLVAIERFYQSLSIPTVVVSGTREAELAKLAENTFRNVNIALVNELAMLAHDLGIDVWQAIDAAGTKPFGFMRFAPGPGVGGHCLPIDPSYMSWQVQRRLGRPFRFVELANDVNDHMPDYVVQRLMRALNARGQVLYGSRILLLGVAYKPNTGDARESPAWRMAELLADLDAEVVAADPHFRGNMKHATQLVDATGEEFASADAVVLVTNHRAFDYDLLVRRARYVLDCRGCLPVAPHVERL